MFDYDRLALDVAQEFTGGNLHRLQTSPNVSHLNAGPNEENSPRSNVSDLSSADIFDCGSSSGYGSPGVAGTPLASPAPNSCAFISQSVQKMLLDQGFCDELAKQSKALSIGAKAGGLQLNTSDLSSLIAGMTVDQVDDSIQSAKSVPLSTSSSQTSNGSLVSDSLETTPTAQPAKAAPVAVEDGFSPDEIAQFAELLCSPKKTPPSRYQCHICYNTGHYISDCPMRFNSPYEELTPYQGRKKCYGEFTCQTCKRRWTSQNSVANEAQSCIKCHVPVFPHKQLPVDKAIALGLVKAQRTVPSKVAPIGHGRPPFQAVRP